MTDIDAPVERDLWWGYLCPALANIVALKEAQSDLVALGADWAEAGRILSRVQSFYVDATHQAARRYLAAQEDVVGPVTIATAPSLFAVETFAVAVLGDGSEVRMRNLVDRVEIRTWDNTGSCNPPPLEVTRVGRHVVDASPRVTPPADAEVAP